MNFSNQNRLFRFGGICSTASQTHLTQLDCKSSRTTYISNATEIDTTYQSTLYDIAYQCPMEGGPAVFIARGLYYYMTGDITFEFENNCIETTGFMRKGNVVAESIDVSVFPTLIGAERFVEVISNADGVFTLSDISGRIILNQKMNERKVRIDLNKNILPGMYFYHFNFGTGNKNGKLIIAE